MVRNMYGSILRIRQLKLTLNVCDYVNKDIIQYFQDIMRNVGIQVPTIIARKTYLEEVCSEVTVTCLCFNSLNLVLAYQNHKSK